MFYIYHNNRCSKSREALQYLENLNQPFEVIYYLEKHPTINELKTVLNKLNITAHELVRKNEAIWKENYKGKTFSEVELITIMCENPKLIERPIVIKENKAVVARPANLIETLL